MKIQKDENGVYHAEVKLTYTQTVEGKERKGKIEVDYFNEEDFVSMLLTISKMCPSDNLDGSFQIELDRKQILKLRELCQAI